VAGLGIVGVAVALAVTAVLGDLLASLFLLLDKPFVVGDFIVVDAFSGTVQDVGLKSTRLRSISGEQIILSNSDLLKSRVRNYKRMTERRVLFTLGVEYGTPEARIAEIPDLLRGIVAANEKARFERAHFQRFGASSLDFEVVYWVTDPDYNLYMDIQQRINLDILRAFREREIGFAFPTQTVRVRGDGGDGIVRTALPVPRADAEATPRG
jgi:small-conductance mechanosensitive channel